MTHATTFDRKVRDAGRIGDRLSDRVFFSIVPQLAQGFLDHRGKTPGTAGEPSRAELDDIHDATLTLLYRLLFLLYAESRHLVPIDEEPYQAASITRIRHEIAAKAGATRDEADSAIRNAYSSDETTIFDRLTRLFHAIADGDASLNLPKYNGGLFDSLTERKHTADGFHHDRRRKIGRFLIDHRVPDQRLALAIDRLSRDQHQQSSSLEFVDYKSLDVRYLGAVYEWLLEFQLKIAKEDLTATTEKAKQKLTPLSQTAVRRRSRGEVVVEQGEVYLANDKADRRASGSYYTPDPIVKYIVAHTVGPVLDAKLDSLRSDFQGVRTTPDTEIKRAGTGSIPRSGRNGKTGRQPRDGQTTHQAQESLFDRLLDLHVCDPAMGSGYFLLEVVHFVTERLLKFLGEFPVNPVNDVLERTRSSIFGSLNKQGVSVAPAHLSDMNLLRRHVVTRCLYGVDLDPMAVELAKVSLWLDCFAVGTPLNFLDDHLRCGNSLIGATFDDLDTATPGRRLPGDDAKTIDAIRRAVEVGQRDGVTEPEGGRTGRRSASARRHLERVRIAFDLLAAGHIGAAVSPKVIEHCRKHGIATWEALGDSLNDDEERERIRKVEEIAGQGDGCFFHWEIEFPEIFFRCRDKHRQDMHHRSNILQSDSAGFDCVVGNPPYDVLAEKEIGPIATVLSAYLRSNTRYRAALGGKLNLYKAFVVGASQIVRDGGTIGMIVPMPLLADRQALGLRKLHHSTLRFRRIEAFPTHLDAKARVFEDANLTTCIFVSENVVPKPEHTIEVRVNRGGEVDIHEPPHSIAYADIRAIDPDGLSIPVCTAGEWGIIRRVNSLAWIEPLGRNHKSYQGEVNETTHRQFLHDAPTDVPVLRGAHVCRYAVRDNWRRNDLYIHGERFRRASTKNGKSRHHDHERVGFQRSAPQNNFRRLIAAPIPAGRFCFDTVSYFLPHECRYSPRLLLGFLNSEFLDWYFDTGSTNSKINEYRLKQLPIPRFAAEVVQQDMAADSPHDTDELLRRAHDDLNTCADSECRLPASVVTAVTKLVGDLCTVEHSRVLESHRDRSSLAGAAQIIQNKLDDLVFACYCVSDHERTLIAESLRVRRG